MWEVGPFVGSTREERLPIFVQMTNEPAYDPLRGNPRFQALLRKMNLPS